MAAGGAIFSVQVRNSVTTGGSVANTASLAGNTLPTPQTGGLAVSGSATANLTLTTPAANAKTISATTEPDTAGANVAVGEVVTYRVTFTLPEGVTQGVRIVDEMQGGLANFGYVPGSARLARNSTALLAANDPGGINTTAVDTFVDVPVQCVATAPCAANEVRIDLGNVTNAPDPTVSPDSYTLEIRFRVLNVAGNQGGEIRANRGRLVYRPTGAGADQTLDGGTVTATVVAPIVQVQKTASPVSIAGGGTVTYTLTIRNNASGPGAGPAYDFAFGDTLPAELGAPALVLPLPVGVSAAFVGNVLAGTVAQLDPSTQVQVQYTANRRPGDATRPDDRQRGQCAGDVAARPLRHRRQPKRSVHAAAGRPRHRRRRAHRQRRGEQSRGGDHRAVHDRSRQRHQDARQSAGVLRDRRSPRPTRSASRCRSALPRHSESATRFRPGSCSTRGARR